MTTRRDTRKLVIHISGLLTLLFFWCTIIFLAAALNGQATLPLLAISASICTLGGLVCAIDYRHVTR